MPNLNIKASHTTLTQSLHDYVDQALIPLQKYLREENSIRVELEADPNHYSGQKFRAEILIYPKPGLHVDARATDLYVAIDMAVKKAKAALLKSKDKKVTARKQRTRASRLV
jgi:ribosomal subunit interface protein